MVTGLRNGKLLAVEHFLSLHKIEFTNRDSRFYSVCYFQKGFTLIACIIGIIINVFVLHAFHFMPLSIESNCNYVKMVCFFWYLQCSKIYVNPVDTGRKLNVHKTFRRRPGRLLNVLCKFNLRLVSTVKLCILSRVDLWCSVAL